MRRVLAAALLCVTLLFCGLDSSAVGHPAEGETVLHAVSHGQAAGAKAASTVAAPEAFVALCVLAVIAGSPEARVLRRRRAARAFALAEGWLARRITRGPPARA